MLVEQKPEAKNGLETISRQIKEKLIFIGTAFLQSLQLEVKYRK